MDSSQVATRPRLGSRYRDVLRIADGDYFAAARLRAPDGTTSGHVFGYQGSPSWLVVAVTEAGRGGRYRIEVIRGGRSAVLGSMHGTRTWGGDLGGDLHGVDAVRLEGRDGEEFVARF